mmetsp:Transcript_20990/g.58407  ORF Transcript_20990/g.58407 Transcript_20990/m.58407 type:complete len:102 (+) Transcript_20990:155-460(+)
MLVPCLLLFSAESFRNWHGLDEAVPQSVFSPSLPPAATVAPEKSCRKVGRVMTASIIAGATASAIGICTTFERSNRMESKGRRLQKFSTTKATCQLQLGWQ